MVLACGSPSPKAEWEWRKRSRKYSLSLPQCPGLSKLDKGNDSAFNHEMNKEQIWIQKKQRSTKTFSNEYCLHFLAEQLSGCAREPHFDTEHPIYSNPGHIPQETVDRNSANFCSGAVWRTVATRAYFEKEINNHIQEEKKLFGRKKHVAKTLVTASRSRFAFLQLFFALTEPILRPGNPSQLLSPTSCEAVKNPFSLVVSNCDTDKMSTRD